MKLFIATAISLFALNSYAYVSFTCKENNVKKGRTVTLEQIGDESIVEGKKFPFKLNVIKKPVGGKEVAVIEASKLGTVESEDVSFDFTSNDGEVQFGIFLDELNESWLQIGNEPLSTFTCN